MTVAPEPTPASTSTSASAGAAVPEHRARPTDDRVLRLIAIERLVRAVALVAIGIVLITHSHADWGRTINDAARSLGFDPSRNGIQKLIEKVRAISPNRYVVFGVVAVLYGILEAVEGYGLWKRRRWAEYLTVLATSLLFIPEIYEITKRATAGKAVALVVNAAIVAFLVWRLRRHE